MLVNLLCSDALKKLLTELFEVRGLQIDATASITLVEKGFELPVQGIAVVFDYQSLNELIDFLDTLSRKPDNNKTIIVGRQPETEKHEIISFADIIYFESEGNHTYCVTGNNKLRVKNKLYELEISLLKQGFVRISKSLLVNIMYVAEIIPWFGSRLLLKLKGHQEIEVSRNYVKGFKDYLEL